MKIESTKSAFTLNKNDKIKSKKSDDTGFEKLVKINTQSIQSQASLNPVNALWIQQEIDEILEKKKRQTKRGSKLLDHLDQIKHSLMSNQLTASQLSKLGELLAQEKEMVEDIKLREIIEEIELRAAVELAKYSA